MANCRLLTASLSLPLLPSIPFSRHPFFCPLSVYSPSFLTLRNYLRWMVLSYRWIVSIHRKSEAGGSLRPNCPGNSGPSVPRYYSPFRIGIILSQIVLEFDVVHGCKRVLTLGMEWQTVVCLSRLNYSDCNEVAFVPNCSFRYPCGNRRDWHPDLYVKTVEKVLKKKCQGEPITLGLHSFYRWTLSMKVIGT